MADNTAIEWATHTWSPWVGCTKVSAACDHCYAETWAKRSGHPELWQGERRRTSAAYWQKPLKWNDEAARTGVRPRVFPSLCDPFDNQVPQRWRDDFWHRIEQTPHLDWTLLTKRPQNIAKFLPDPRTGTKPWGDGWPNVWLGTTAENQEEWDRRVTHLGAIPAALHFVSVEPMLERIDAGNAFDDESDAYRPIKWIICGGESGSNARPLHPAWPRALRDQCQAAGVPFFFKQWGEHLPLPGYTSSGEYLIPQDIDTPTDIRRAHNLTGDQVWRRVGKKAAGRRLDGREWSEFPGGTGRATAGLPGSLGDTSNTDKSNNINAASQPASAAGGE